MSEPAKGVWRIGTTDPQRTYPSEAAALERVRESAVLLEVVAYLPASAQVVEMPTAPGERPCVYVRGESSTRWRALCFRGEHLRPFYFDADDEASARQVYETWLSDLRPGHTIQLVREVVIETRTKEEPAGE